MIYGPGTQTGKGEKQVNKPMYTNASTCIGYDMCNDYIIVITYIYIHDIYIIKYKSW